MVTPIRFYGFSNSLSQRLLCCTLILTYAFFTLRLMVDEIMNFKWFFLLVRIFFFCNEKMIDDIRKIDQFFFSLFTNAVNSSFHLFKPSIMVII